MEEIHIFQRKGTLRIKRRVRVGRYPKVEV
jgi:hypothetical protein